MDVCHDHSVMIRVKYARSVGVVDNLFYLYFDIVRSIIKKRPLVYIHRPKYGTQLRR